MEISIQYLVERLKIDIALLKAGLPIEDDYLYETYGIPKPKNYKELKKKMEQMLKAALKQLDPDAGDDQEEDTEEDEDPVKKQPKPKAKKKTRFKRLRNWLRKSGIAGFFS